MSVTVYKSTDASAPTLTGTVGDLINLLDKCLVTGYGAKAAAGWAKPFTATNAAVFRAASGLRHYYHFDDNAPQATALAKEAQFRGSETASAVLTGTGFFPTTAQQAAGAACTVRKSTTADATPRAWQVVADARTVYVFIATGDSAGVYQSVMFGEIYSLSASLDSYASMVIGRTPNTGTSSGGFLAMANITLATAALSNHYIARSYTAGGTSLQVSKITESGLVNNTSVSHSFGQGSLVGVDPCLATLIVSPVRVCEVSVCVRGRLRGLFEPMQASGTFGDGDVITPVTGPYAGRTLYIIKAVDGSSGNIANGSGPVAIDITGPWETN